MDEGADDVAGEENHQLFPRLRARGDYRAVHGMLGNGYLHRQLPGNGGELLRDAIIFGLGEDRFGDTVLVNGIALSCLAQAVFLLAVFQRIKKWSSG